MSAKPEFLTDSELKAALEYLDDLRESGRTNMWGAREYLIAEFSEDLTDDEAAEILVYWMQTFGERHEVTK